MRPIRRNDYEETYHRFVYPVYGFHGPCSFRAIGLVGKSRVPRRDDVSLRTEPVGVSPSTGAGGESAKPEGDRPIKVADPGNG